MRNIVLIYLLSSPFIVFYAQTDTTSQRKLLKINWLTDNEERIKFKPKKLIAPTFLFALSFALSEKSTKTNLQDQVRKPFNNFSTRIDDLTPFVPVAELYIFDLLKIKAKNSIWNQTKYLAFSQFTTAGLVLILKEVFKVQRPDNGTFNSFPSGHTAVSFVSSQVLFNEYYESNKLIAFSGLLSSISTGGLRVVNNKHWVPDVIMGAGIGILVTNLVYHFKPLKNWNPWKKKDLNLSFSPIVGQKYTGIQLFKKL